MLVVAGPTSLLVTQELRNLGGNNDAHRGAGYLCQLADSDQIRHSCMCWSTFHEVHAETDYEGPMPKNHSCIVHHYSMTGALMDGGFSILLCLLVWAALSVVAAALAFGRPTSQGVGVKCGRLLLVLHLFRRWFTLAASAAS